MAQSTYRTPVGLPGRALVQTQPRPVVPAPRRWFAHRTFPDAPIPVPTVSTLVQDVWPPRVLVTVTGILGSDTLTIYRVVGGVRTPIRGADGITVTGLDAVVKVDAELPFGVVVSYYAELDSGAYTGSSAPLTVDLVGDTVAFTDAISGNVASGVISAWPDKQRSRLASTFQVGGRSIVVAGPRGGFSSSIEVFTETQAQGENFASLLAGATGATVQIRQSGPYDRVDCYVAVVSDNERRFSSDGSDERRLWTLDVVEVDGWASSLPPRGFTYADVAAKYTGLTYANLASDYAAYLLLAQGDFS